MYCRGEENGERGGVSGYRGESPLMNSLVPPRGISAFRPVLKSYSSVEEAYSFSASRMESWLVRASVRARHSTDRRE